MKEILMNKENKNNSISSRGQLELPVIRFCELSKMQQKILRILYKERNSGWYNIAGYGRAPHLSAANSLVRKGLAISKWTGRFAISDLGEELASKNV